uniref:Histone H2A/H2B/H3 domain-containing protein n=1 Tax=Meloidogyne javanica TaxID=6303 RepID=A0A915LYB8_MELJA
MTQQQQQSLLLTRNFATKSVSGPTTMNTGGIHIDMTPTNFPRQTARKRVFPAKNLEVLRSQQQNKIKAPGEGGSLTLKEIRKYQNSVNLIIPRAAFIRLVREVANKLTEGRVLRWKGLALIAIQEAAEHYLVDMFEGANLCALHTGRVTLMQKDVRLLRQLRGEANKKASTNNENSEV